MYKIMILSIACAFSCNALNSPNGLIENACTLDEDAYGQLPSCKRSEYCKTIAAELNAGTLKPHDIINKANCSLRCDVARCCYLSYGKQIDLNTETIAFPLRILIEHKRLDRAVSPQGELDLSYLHLADLDGIDQIPNITSVRVLNLSHNEISLLHPDNFKVLPQLTKLDLSFNRLSSLRQRIFKHLPLLHDLHLNHNHITHLDKDTFIALTRLQELDISHNKIQWIGIGALNDLNHLQRVNLSNNRLRLISPRVLNPLSDVRTFNISHNKFTLIHSQVLHPLRKLEHLDASNNNIRQLTDDVLYGLKKLEVLNLRNNKIAMIHFDTPHILPNLSTIILGNNPITNKHLTLLRSHLPKIKILKNDPQSSLQQVALSYPR